VTEPCRGMSGCGAFVGPPWQRRQRRRFRSRRRRRRQRRWQRQRRRRLRCRGNRHRQRQLRHHQAPAGPTPAPAAPSPSTAAAETAADQPARHLEPRRRPNPTTHDSGPEPLPPRHHQINPATPHRRHGSCTQAAPPPQPPGRLGPDPGQRFRRGPVASAPERQPHRPGTVKGAARPYGQTLDRTPAGAIGTSPPRRRDENRTARCAVRGHPAGDRTPPGHTNPPAPAGNDRGSDPVKSAPPATGPPLIFNRDRNMEGPAQRGDPSD
jgi:hypothetical protein